jgi:hypothetical protein
MNIKINKALLDPNFLSLFLWSKAKLSNQHAVQRDNVQWEGVATCGRRLANGGWWCGRRPAGNSRIAITMAHYASHTGTTPQHRDRWSLGSFGMRVPVAGSARRAAMASCTDVCWLGQIRLVWPCLIGSNI